MGCDVPTEVAPQPPVQQPTRAEAQPTGPRLPPGVTELPSYVVAEEWKPSQESDFPVGHSQAYREAYTYTASSKDNPVRVGFFHGGRCHHFYRAYLSDSFDRAGVNVEMYTSFLNDPYRFEPVSRNFEREYARRDAERMGRVTGTVLNTILDLGELDAAMIGEASAIMAAKQGLPVVAVARMGHGDADVPGFMIVMRNGLGAKTAEDLRGKTVSSRRAGPGDEVLLREFFHQAGMVAGTDYNIVNQTNDDQQHDWLKTGDIDAGLYHMYGISRSIDKGKAELMRVMDWLPGDLPAAYLVFRKDFLRDRPDDVQRILRGLMWRLEYERELPEVALDLNRQFGYVLRYFWRGTRLPHTTFPFTVARHHLSMMQELMLRHGALDTPADLEALIVDQPFDLTLQAEHARGEILPPPPSDLAAATPSPQGAGVRMAAVTEGTIDMFMGLDASVAPGLLLRKLEESTVGFGLLFDQGSTEQPNWGPSLVHMAPERLAHLETVPVRVSTQARTWKTIRTTPHRKGQALEIIRTAKAKGFPVWVRDEPADGMPSPDLVALLAAHRDTPFIWLHGGFASPDALPDALRAHPNLHVGLGGMEHVQDLLNPPATPMDQPWAVTRKKSGYKAKPIKTWVELVNMHPTRFVFTSDLFTSLQYEIDHKAKLAGFGALLEALEPAVAEQVARKNGQSLMGHSDAP